mmetsp:Transcript_22503/g.30119  ORF Transcript_22503/g.30119 Transcript_22503/m.30119 type:complete len:148 (+) Transcript_22503:35-478(+)
MKLIWILLCTTLVFSCSESQESTEKKTDGKKNSEQAINAPVNKEDLVEVVGSTYKEYYDVAKTKIKFEGEQDEQKKRHGKWVHYFENGTEAGITFYTHGIRNGFSSVHRPNGILYYHGEYKDDKPTGIWKYYDKAGNLNREHNYDEE